MLTMQHFMLAKLTEQDEEPLSDAFVGGLLFPDAIRAYGVSRRVSHFELADDGSGRSSGWVIPNRMDAIEGPIGPGGSTLPDSLSYHDLAPACPHAAFGQYTDVPRFCEAAHAFDSTTEYGLEMLRGISVHLLAQDLAFDVFVREHLLDVTGMGSGIYIDRISGRSLDGGEARAYVTEVERQGIY